MAMNKIRIPALGVGEYLRLKIVEVDEEGKQGAYYAVKDGWPGYEPVWIHQSACPSEAFTIKKPELKWGQKIWLSNKEWLVISIRPEINCAAIIVDKKGHTYSLHEGEDWELIDE